MVWYVVLNYFVRYWDGVVLYGSVYGGRQADKQANISALTKIDSVY